MSERTLIELLHGSGAHADPLACVRDVPAELAGRVPEHFDHSIWQLLCHMNYWMDYDTSRIRGEKRAYPLHAAESWPETAAPQGEREWKQEVARFEKLLAEFSAMAAWDSEALQATCRPLTRSRPR